VKARVRGVAYGLTATVAIVLLAVLQFGTAYGGSSAASGPGTTTFGISGYLVASPNPNLAGEPPISQRGHVQVPGVPVRLLRGARAVQKVRTDLSGRFVFAPRAPGQYNVCWGGAGWVPRCVETTLERQHVHLLPTLIVPARAKGEKTVYGIVRFRDQSFPRTVEPLANVNAFAMVRPETPGGVLTAPAAYVNNDGEYVLPRVRVLPTATLRASIEKDQIRVAANLRVSGVSLARRITLKNRQPRRVLIEARALVGGGRLTAAPGEAVRLSAAASDPDRDRLRYRWILPGGSSVFSPGGTITYTMPSGGSRGDYVFTAVAFDGRGGYAKEEISISTSGVLFGGVVVGTDGPALADATVEVNGARATTDADGRFVLVAPEAPRFIVNIHRTGYAYASRTYDSGITGGRWEMTPATVTSVDPTGRFEVVDVPAPRGDCPGAIGDRDTNRDRRVRGCGSGFRISIPANALVDADGNPPTGRVRVQVSTIDLRAPDAMPGDSSARLASGAIERMESFGAGTVEIDVRGRDYNLRPGATAQVTIPLDPDRFAAGGAPATIPLLHYDESAGDWVEDGVANLVGDEYIGTVTHLSAINADIVRSDGACIRIESPLMPSSFALQATTFPRVPTLERVVTKTFANRSQRFHALYGLPPNAPVELKVFVEGTTTVVPLLVGGASTEIVTLGSGGQQTPPSPFQPVFPYQACKSVVELIPFRKPPETVDTFLAGFYNFPASNLTELNALDPDPRTGRATTIIEATERYYLTIDPLNLRAVRGAFLVTNGFLERKCVPDGFGERCQIVAVQDGNEVIVNYANAADLGFGRDMHCRKNGHDVACYVDNYGDRFTDNVADAQAATRNHHDEFPGIAPTFAVPGSGSSAHPGTLFPIQATVAMEYSRVENARGGGFQQAPGGGDLRIVKFYVYDGAGARINAANLDGYGARPIPALCMMCHGGTYPPAARAVDRGAPIWNIENANSADLGSAFIPFDLNSYELPKVQVPNVLRDLLADQQDDFKKLNLEIVAATNPPDATIEVLDQMYAGGTATNQITDFVVPGWRGTQVAPNQETTYRSVVAPSCRGCHMSQARSDIAFNTAEQMKIRRYTAGGLVFCSHQMPHAVETHNRFWLSSNPHQPLVIADFLTAANNGVSISALCPS
jgi:hypothetical protein